jgi:hypothetical protein
MIIGSIIIKARSDNIAYDEILKTLKTVDTVAWLTLKCTHKNEIIEEPKKVSDMAVKSEIIPSNKAIKKSKEKDLLENIYRLAEGMG